MTAFEFSRRVLNCDGGGCYESVQGEEGIRPTSGETLGALRKRAGKAGWTHVRCPSGLSRWDSDYCPAHNPVNACPAVGTAEMTDEEIIADTDIPTIPYVVDGSEWVTEEQARAYLVTSGYEAEADGLIEDAKRFADYRYTADRHRYLTCRYSGGVLLFKTGDCAKSGERIKALLRALCARRGER